MKIEKQTRSVEELKQENEHLLYLLFKRTDISPGYTIDHSAISFTFSGFQNKRGKGYWKFNSQ